MQNYCRPIDNLVAYRGFIDTIVARKNARNAKRIESKRPSLQVLPDRRTCDYEDMSVRVTSAGGFRLGLLHCALAPRRPSIARAPPRRRLEVFVGGTHLATLPWGRPSRWPTRSGVDYRHVIHALRRKPMALLNLIYRDRLFPREAYRLAFEALRDALPDHRACRITVDLLALAHERSCEAELAQCLVIDL